MGLGDVVHSVLHPFAEHVIDPIFQTDYANCIPCNKDRVEWLNQIGQNVYYYFTQQKPNEKDTMNYVIQIDVEAEDVKSALDKISEGKIISVNPRQIQQGMVQRPVPQPLRQVAPPSSGPQHATPNPATIPAAT